MKGKTIRNLERRSKPKPERTLNENNKRKTAKLLALPEIKGILNQPVSMFDLADQSLIDSVQTLKTERDSLTSLTSYAREKSNYILRGNCSVRY